MSLLMRLCVSSTIIRIRRKRRRSTNPERTSVLDWASNFGMLVRSGNAGQRGHIPSGVLSIAVGPDCVGLVLFDSRFVVADGRSPHRADRHEIEHATRQ